MAAFRFNPPPGWPVPPDGWRPPAGWTADPSWPEPPPGWVFWVAGEATPSLTASTPPTAGNDQGLDWRSEEGASAATPSTASTLRDSETDAADDLAELRASVETRRQELADLDAAISQVRHDAAQLAEETERSKSAIREELIELDDARMLQQVGIYEYHHPLENAEMYRARLNSLRERIKSAVKNRSAVLASDMFSYNNSLAMGRRMTSDFSKLMLRAYNAEADSSVRSLRAGNLATAQQRLEVSASSIARLGAMMEMRVAPDYHKLRLEELELTADHLMKVQEEREQAREERERLREERRAEEELVRERERLTKERAHYANALQSMREQGLDSSSEEIEERLAVIDAAIAQNEFRVANIRAGYVYVVSNIGAFGRRVVKIGMTRRLDPLDRIRELGDASVPFPFDVHALYFSDDAVTLEGELHDAFASNRLNQANLRREFFFATPEEVRTVLIEKLGNLLEFVEQAEATQYFQSVGHWKSASVGPGS